MKIGRHVSIKKGYFAAAKQMYEWGGKAFQYFPKNPRSLQIKKIDEKDAWECAQFCRQNNMSSIAHSPYPTNLCSFDLNKANEVIQSLLNDLYIAESCGSIGVVVHFGKYNGTQPLEAYITMVNTLNTVLDEWEGTSLLLIENHSGQGGNIGTTVEECIYIRQLTDYPEKIGFCFDTCHAFVSGMWGSNTKDFKDHELLNNYLTQLKAIHLNDSVYPANSKRDRHANIGHGCITSKQLFKLIQSPHINDLPIILETPKNNFISYEEELNNVRNNLHN